MAHTHTCTRHGQNITLFGTGTETTCSQLSKRTVCVCARVSQRSRARAMMSVRTTNEQDGRVAGTRVFSVQKGGVSSEIPPPSAHTREKRKLQAQSLTVTHCHTDAQTQPDKRRKNQSGLRVAAPPWLGVSPAASTWYYNITLLQKFNNCARTTCTITDNRHYGSPPPP